MLVGGLSIALTFGLWQHERSSQGRDLRSHFDFALRQTSNRIEQRMASYEQMLRGVRGLFDASGHVSRHDFETYVGQLQSGADFTGLRAIAYAPLRPDGTAPVTYLAPAAGPPGDDLLADPVRRAAMLQARDAGSAIVTPALRPAAPGAGPEVQLFMPLYTRGEAPANVAERRRHLVGWVVASFRLADLVSSVYGEGTPGLDLRIHDGAGQDEATRLYPPALPDGPPPPARFDAQEYIGFAGHTWTLWVRSTPDFEAQFSNDAPQIIAIAGTGLSAVLALVGWLLVTGRARAHDAARVMTRQLRDSERQYRRIVETAREGIWVVDAAGRTVFANPALLRLLGQEAGALVGRPWTDWLDEADRVRLAGTGAAGPARSAELQHDLRLRRRDGSTLWAALSTSPIVDDAGQAAGVLVMVTDVSERHEAEARRVLLEDQLRQSQKMEAIGTLAGGIAHDFNNILAAILGNVALVRQDLGEAHPSLPRLAQIGQAGGRARSLVQQIVAFSRQQPQALVAQPLRPLLEESVRLLRSTLPARVELVLQADEPPRPVAVDATQLQQVLMNLCTNAWHALPGGAGQIVIGLAPCTLDAATAERLGGGLAAGPCAHLWVHDDGCGMDEATRARIFEPFYTTKPVGQGTGLGLSVVHGIVASHGGAITVDSQPGRGSTFDLYFPLAPLRPATAATAAGSAPADTPAAAAAGRGQHVLYVDDDPVMLLMVESLLQRLGYRVSGLADPRQALARVQATADPVDLVVTDFNMPDLSGLELAEALVRARPGLPVVVTSGYVSESLRADAARVGVRQVLQKEYTLEQLGPLVQRLLATAVVPAADAGAPVAGA